MDLPTKRISYIEEKDQINIESKKQHIYNRPIGRVALALSVASLFFAGKNINSVEAADNSYPYSAAPDVRPGSPYYEWGYKSRDFCGSFCDSAGGHTDLADGRYYLYSARGYAIRNCTDWAAFRINELTGIQVPSNLGNALTWDNYAPSSYKKDLIPSQVILHKAMMGHLAMLE